ncbi:MAG: hypothetical protein ACRD94_05295, partial [Nitrosopumilaceae archaeon]
MEKKFTLLAFLILIVSINSAYADNSDWKTLELVGKYTNSQPPNPDQTFIVQYRVINATLESVESKDSLEFIANTIEKGILEVKFPRNYPYANFADRDGFYLMINGYGSDVYYLPETTPMMDHVRPKIINDINRPPPHPYTFSEKTDCHFIFSVPFYTFAKIEIAYGGNGLIPSPYYGDDVPEYCIKETIVDTNNNLQRYQSPKKQIQEGVELYSINCNEGLHRAIRQNEKPACLSLETLKIFYERNLIIPEGIDYEKLALDSARDFILSHPTFSYDGMKGSLSYSITAIRESLPPYITVDAYFTNHHPGYGGESNRKDLTENWSQHSMQIGISGVGHIDSAIIDMEWDEV